jgi:ketosteroid isomerase-like protein
MSPKSSDVVRKHFDAFETGGVDAVATFWHPEIEWRAVEGAADDVGLMHGHDALRRYYQDWVDTLEGLRAEVEDILFEVDDRVAAVVHNSGRGRASGVPAEGRYYVACIVRGGHIVAVREYGTRQEALDSVRLLGGADRDHPR